jgi:hypothetical protein
MRSGKKRCWAKSSNSLLEWARSVCVKSAAPQRMICTFDPRWENGPRKHIRGSLSRGVSAAACISISINYLCVRGARSVREKTASAAAQITPVDGHGMRKLQSRNQREREMSSNWFCPLECAFKRTHIPTDWLLSLTWAALLSLQRILLEMISAFMAFALTLQLLRRSARGTDNGERRPDMK